MAITSTKKTTTKKQTAEKTDSGAEIKLLEAKIAALEKSLSDAVLKIEQAERKVEILDAAVASKPEQKSGSEDPRLDELIPKLRALVSKCKRVRGQETKPWPKF